MSPNHIQSVKEWWGKNVNHRPVWRKEDLPEPYFKDILASLKLAYEVRRDTVVLGKPDTGIEILIHSYFWEIISCVLKPYSPYMITGIAAFNLHLSNESLPKEVAVITKNSSTRIDLHGVTLLVIEKQPKFFQRKDTEKCVAWTKTNKNYPLTFESPESLLVSLRPQSLRNYPQVISAFLKGIHFDLEILKVLLMQETKPIVYLRIAALFEQIGKNREADLIRHTVRMLSHYAMPGKAQIIKYPLPAAVAGETRLSDPVYVTQFRDQLRVYSKSIEAQLKNIKLPTWKLPKLRAYAEQTKKYDTYHSSTIEGYRVTEEEIQFLMEGRSITTQNASKEEIERKMALKGYLEAHQFVLRTITDNFKKGSPVTEFIIREIYAHLFSPSVEAGLSTKEQLTRYRNEAVYIRNSRHVPPNYQKIDNLMRCMVEEVNEVQNQAVRALLAHYGFVTIHPYFDGNGRVARLLMNTVLCLGGIPWITIRIEDRDQYFRALETAQCDENIIPFTTFLMRYLKESQKFSVLPAKK